jgi:plasmid stability protein
MATITIRNVDDVDYERLKSEAKANHRSLEAEARARLRLPSRDTAKMIAEMKAFQERLKSCPVTESSVDAVRAVRDEM